MMSRTRRILVAAIAAGLLTTAAWGAELATRKALTLEVAKGVAAVAEQHAIANKWNVVIAVLDEGGHLLYLQRMDGTQVGSVEVAIQKATSAAYFKRPTKAFSDAVGGGRVAILGLPGAMAIEGGLPIEWEGQIIGAIGVSGVTSEQDGMIAKAGVDALAKIVGR
jgi:uncharacterized protein GlcG (DUF336 family)